MSEIFISWSKDRSLSFAKALRQLIAQVLRDPAYTSVPPFGPGHHLVSLSEDLPKGGSWLSNLAGSTRECASRHHLRHSGELLIALVVV